MAEIRLRDVKPDFLKKLEAIQKDLKEKTATGALVRLVEGYANNQSFIAQLSKRNTDLHKSLQRYHDAEGDMRDNIRSCINSLEITVRDIKPLLKGLTNKAGTKRNQARKARTR